ncbi:MAG: DUF1349 domain-containing protein [Halodesulfurarchaeum sp.]
MKAGIEYVDGTQQTSTGITREFSDWSIAPLGVTPQSVWVRVERTGEAVETFLSTDGHDFTRYRQGYHRGRNTCRRAIRGCTTGERVRRRRGHHHRVRSSIH